MTEAQARRRPSWGRLGTELRRLRRQAGLNQEAVARALGVSKATVERIELGGAHGGSPPSVQAVTDWARACEVANPDFAGLRLLAESALDEHRPYRDWGTLATRQEGIRADEATAMTLRNFNPWGIPGLLQTPDYARSVLEMSGPRSAADVAEAVAIRMRRQAILYEPGRRFEFLVTEEGLRRRPATAPVQQAQLAHLTSVTTQPMVTFGVIPLDRPLRAVPACGFVLYEDRAEEGSPFAAIELPHERVEASTPDDVGLYCAMYEVLREEAVTGKQAQQLIAGAVAELSDAG